MVTRFNKQASRLPKQVTRLRKRLASFKKRVTGLTTQVTGLLKCFAYTCLHKEKTRWSKRATGMGQTGDWYGYTVACINLFKFIQVPNVFLFFFQFLSNWCAPLSN